MVAKNGINCFAIVNEKISFGPTTSIFGVKPYLMVIYFEECPKAFLDNHFPQNCSTAFGIRNRFGLNSCLDDIQLLNLRYRSAHTNGSNCSDHTTASFLKK